MNCPRCKNVAFNTFSICRYEYRVPINKCKVCGYLWINDEDMIGMAKREVKQLFIESLRSIGKGTDSKPKKKVSRKGS